MNMHDHARALTYICKTTHLNSKKWNIKTKKEQKAPLNKLRTKQHGVEHASAAMVLELCGDIGFYNQEHFSLSILLFFLPQSQEDQTPFSPMNHNKYRPVSLSKDVHSSPLLNATSSPIKFLLPILWSNKWNTLVSIHPGVFFLLLLPSLTSLYALLNACHPCVIITSWP